MKRLLLVLGLLTVAGAALAAGSTTFHFGFPKFAAVFVNVSDVYFFTNGTGDSGALAPTSGSYADIGSDTYFSATAEGVESCIEKKLSTNGLSVTIKGSAGNDSLTSTVSCLFAPTSVVKYSSTFSVAGYNNVVDSGYNPASPPTDGELLVITNFTSGGFNISTTVDTTGGGVPTGMSLEVYPGFVEENSSSKQIKALNTSASWQSLNSASSSSALFTNNDAFYTNFAYARVIPLLFRVNMNDVLAASPIVSEQKLIVTWNAAAQ